MPRRRKFLAVVAQLVERVLGKDEVTGSIPVNGSRIFEVLRVWPAEYSHRASLHRVDCGSGRATR